jgi:hypothetical protein
MCRGDIFSSICTLFTKLSNHVICMALAITKLIQLNSKSFSPSGCIAETPPFLCISQLLHQLPNFLYGYTIWKMYYLGNQKPFRFSTTCRNLNLFCRSDFHYFRNEDNSYVETCHVSWHWNRTSIVQLISWPVIFDGITIIMAHQYY